MKKFVLLMVVSVLCLCSVGGMSVFAQENSAEVYVTIADDKGELAVAAEKIDVADNDGDGVISINDALFAAHEAFFDGGAQAGYGSYESDFGLSMSKLWGVENGGSYGYYINNGSAWSLVDPVKDGDYVAAYAYTDLTAWSDTYCYFSSLAEEAEAGESVELCLSAAGFDAEFNPVVFPVKNAEIIISGENSGIFTDDEGKAVVPFDEAGAFVLSAKSAEATLVPPVCKITVNKKVATPEASETPKASETPEVPETPKVPETDDGKAVVMMFLPLLFAVTVLISLKNRKKYE